ncbi:MAG: hypothetical protein ACQKBY_02395 [Verrucomicrobiales bacterium]
MRLTPNQLYRRYEAGEMEFDEVVEKINEFALDLIEEMEEERGNPVASYVDRLLNKRAAAKLVKEHGEAEVRETLVALSELEDFEPALLLWNADHWDVPLHCFIRLKREPVFRLTKLRVRSREVRAEFEYGAAKRGKATRERVLLKRNWKERLVVEEREVL